MYGVSTIVTLLLILLIMTSLAVTLWMFTSGTVEELTEVGSERTEKTRKILSTCMIVDSVHGNKIYIKNCGDGVVVNDSLNVYLDDEPLEFNMTPETIKKGEIGTIIIKSLNSLELSIGDYDLKISNPSLQIVQRVEANYSYRLDPFCVLALNFDEGEGTVAYDSCSYENNGILINMEPEDWVNGKFGKALRFDGTNEYVTINNVPVNTSFGAYNTVDFWMYWTGTNNQMPFSWPGEMYDLWINSNCFGFNTGESNILGVSSSNLANKWIHVIAIFYNGVPSNTSVSLYIDNIKQNIYPCLGSTTGSRSVSSTIQISGWDSGFSYHFDGIIDSLKVYNKNITQFYANNLKMK